METASGCDECDYRGWAIFNVPFPNEPGDDTGGEIQRCDSCKVLASDDVAIRHAIAAGYVVDRESGAILRDLRRPDMALTDAYVALARLVRDRVADDGLNASLLGPSGVVLLTRIRAMESDRDD